MARKYITKKDGSVKFVNEDEAYSSAESAILGNTDFDAIYNPTPAFNFVLEVEALYFLPIKTVRAFTKENEYEYIREGGVNDYIHLKRKPISKPFTFQIERYVGTERFLDPLANGTELILPLILYVFRHKSIQGFTAGPPAWPARIYTFTGCTVMSKEYGELNAERSGLLTETTTIAYRELIAVTNPFQSSSEQEEWKPEKDSKNRLKYKYAARSPYDDTSQDTYWYEWDQNGSMKIKDSIKNDVNKPMWDGSDVKGKYASRAKPDIADETYQMGEVDGKPAMVRKDESKFNRPQYELKVDKDKEKYATKAYLDQNAGEKIYDQVPGEDGKNHTKRVDHAEINKPAWTGASGSVNQWAKPSGPDKAGNTYKVTTKDGSSIVERTDSGDFNRVQYELAKDKEKQKYSTVAYVDKNAAQPIYKKKGNTVVRNDQSELNKPAYTLNKDRANNKYAQVSPKDKETPVEREPYDISSGPDPKWAAKSPKDDEKPKPREPYSPKDGPEPKWAAKSPKDGEKPEAHDPYSPKDGPNPKWAAKSPKDGEKPEAHAPYSPKEGPNPKWAVKSPRDGEKPEAKAPYSISTDKANNKWAITSPKDKEKPEAVTYPPTRRALMADALKK